MKLPRFAAVAALLTLVGAACAQTASFFWYRTDASTDIALNTVRHALVNADNRLVAVGRSPSPDGFRGNLTIFNRNRAVIASKLLTPPGGGDLELTRLFLYSDAYMVAGTATPTGSTDQQIYMAILDLNLNVMDEIMFPANNGAGEEIVTDLVGTSGHRWICGRARATNGWRTFAYHLTGLVDNPVLLDNSPLGDDPTPQLSYIVQNSTTGVLVYAATTDTGPRIQQYSLTNTLQWSRDLGPAGGSGYRMILDNVGNGTAGNPIVTLSWNDEPTPGSPESHGKIFVLNGSNGSTSDSTPAVDAPGANQLITAGAMLSTSTLNALYDAGNRSAVRSFSASNFGALNTWSSPVLTGQSRSLNIDSFGELLALRSYGNSLYLAKLNTSLVKRFDFYRPTTLNANQMTAGAALSSATGDIFVYASDDHHMQIACYQQAPIAVTEYYPCRRNVLFRPPVSVLSNDRYAAGCTIIITGMPLHGSVTMGADGFFNYRSAPAYTGPDSFRYTISRPGVSPSTATVNLSVMN